MKNFFWVLLFLLTPSISHAQFGADRASRIKTDTANFNNNLSAADNTVQKALETLDETAGGGSGDVTGVGDCTTGACFNGTQGNSLIFEGSTADTNEITVTAADPGADYTVTIPAKTGTIILNTDIDSSTELNALVTDKTGTGALVFGTDPGLNIASGTLVIPSSTSLPGTCSTGQIYMDTDATSGQRLYACQSANTWVLQGDGSTATAGGAGEMLYSDGAGGFASEAAFVYDASTNTLTVDNLVVNAANSLIEFEGATIDAYETTLGVVDPTADNTILLPDVSGTVITTGDTGTVTGTMIANGTIAAADTAITAGRSLTWSTNDLVADAELYTDEKCIYFEDPTASDDFNTIWVAPTASTIEAISCESDQTVNFDLQVDDGTPTGVNGSDIACTTFATDSSLAGDTTLASGDRLDLAITSVSGTPTWVSICWKYTKDD